jgi:chromosome segregation ATPase
MSTAGKVLAVLVMVTSLAWMILSAGVDQLNINATKKLHDLVVQAEKLEADAEKADEEVIELKNATSSEQEKLDHEATALRAQQVDLEKDRSQIKEALSRWQYQLDTVKETIDRANLALRHRNEEQEKGEQLLAKTQSDVKELMDRSAELMNQLTDLRKEFNSTYQSNVESLGKRR